MIEIFLFLIFMIYNILNVYNPCVVVGAELFEIANLDVAMSLARATFI